MDFLSMLDTSSDYVSLECHELQVKDKTAFVEIHKTKIIKTKIFRNNLPASATNSLCWIPAVLVEKAERELFWNWTQANERLFFRVLTNQSAQRP